MTESERLKRWRLVLGSDAENSCGSNLAGTELGMDQALEALYKSDKPRSGGLGGSAPKVTRWLGDIRTYFPSSVVRVMQQDALERLNLQQMLLEPEMMQAVEADVHLVANLMSLSQIMPAKTKETARLVVQKVMDELLRKLSHPMQQAVSGSLNRSIRNRHPRHNEIDWNRTIRANLRHYQTAYRTIIPETKIGFGRKRTALKNIILCVDQSGSMATSVVYASIFAAVLASMPAIKTQMVVFDTAVVDLTEMLQDPVDVLFGTQLGGGTDINKALSYCQGLIRQPQETILVLISDLYEGGNNNEMLKRVGSIVASGVQLVTLLALNDDGAPCFDHRNAGTFATLGSPAFACTPDQFPDLMAATLSRQDIGLWAAKAGLMTTRGK
jgi:Mg-chelatase subunit ChlD